MPHRRERIQHDHEKILRVFNSKSLVRIVETRGDPPEWYLIEYLIKSLTLTAKREVAKISSPRIEISLPEKYPEEPPQCIVVSSVFHPNISEMIDVRGVWESTGDLCEVILFVGKLLSFQKYELKDPLNVKAGQWASKKKGIFPIDPSPLMPDERWREREELLERGESLFRQKAYVKALKEWESEAELADYPAIQQGIVRAREELHRQEQTIQEAEGQLAAGNLERALELLEPLEPIAGEEERFRTVLGKARDAILEREEKRKKALAVMEKARAFLKKRDINGAEKALERIEPILAGQAPFQELVEAVRQAKEEEEARRRKALQEMERARDLIKKGKEEEALGLLNGLADQLKGDLSFEELIRSARQQVEDKKKRRAEALKEMEEARQMFMAGDPENALARLEPLQPILGEQAEYRELLEAMREGIQEKEALRKEIASTLEEAAARLEAGFAEQALTALSSIAPYCTEDENFHALKSAAEELLREKELHLEIERLKSSASRLFDTGQIHEALEEYKKIQKLTEDQDIHKEIERTLEWRFDAKLRAARERLKSMEVEIARTHLHFASLIAPVAQKRESDLKALRMKIELVDRILSHKREAERFQTEKKVEAASQEWRKVLSIDPENAEAQQAIARLKKIAHQKEVVAHASRVGLYVLLAIFLIVAATGGYYTLESQNLRDALTLMKKREYRLAIRKIEQASPPPLLTRTQMRELRIDALYAMHMAEGDRLAAANQWEKALRAYAQALHTGGEGENIHQKIMDISRAQIGRAEDWAAQGKLEQADQLLEAMIAAIAKGEELRSRAVMDRMSVLLKLMDQYINNRRWAEAHKSIQALRSLEEKKPEALAAVDRFRQTVIDRLHEAEKQINEIHRKRDLYAVDITRMKEQFEADALRLADKEADIKSLETRHPTEVRLAGELKAMKSEIDQLNAELIQHRNTVKTIDDQIRIQGEAYKTSSQYQQIDKPAYEFSMQRARELFRVIQEKSDKARSTEENIKEFTQERQRLQKALEDIKKETSSKKTHLVEIEKFLAGVDSLEEPLEKEKTLLSKIQKELGAGP